MVRRPLRDALIAAWESTIAGPYAEQLINSERGLQFFFCSALQLHWQDVNAPERRLFIEPRLVTDDNLTDYRYPDVVICNRARIIGVLELKYMPRVPPQYEKDLGTLRWVAEKGEALSLSNDRYRGPGEDRKRPYPLAPDAILCWAGVYTGPKVPLMPLVQSPAAEHFLELHAVTSRDASPEISWASAPTTRRPAVPTDPSDLAAPPDA